MDPKQQKPREDDSNRLKEQAKRDQGLADLADTFPPLWRRMYVNCLYEGFTPEEALFLLRTWIVSTTPNGPRAPEK